MVNTSVYDLKHADVNLIAAIGICGEIGKGGKLPWKDYDDLHIFKKYTMNDTVVMGRKTWESIPLDNLVERKLYVLSNSVDKTDLDNDIYYIKDVDKIFSNSPRIWIAGGESVYKFFVDENLYDNLFLTKFQEYFPEADKHFPVCEATYGKNCICWYELEDEKYPEGSRVEIWS